jgi:CDP-diacylglycerol--glycerol-3-phosphate 3-phosphatidyltransferase
VTSSKGPSVDPAPTTPGGGASDGPDFAVDPVRAVTHALTVDRVWTVPNALSMLRLLGVPLFLWLLLGPEADGWAIVLLMLAGISDWADGKIARALDQRSQLGTLLDPAADRLYIVATLVALALRDIVPLWLVALLVGREVVLAVVLVLLRRHGYPALQVHYLGKAATFILLYAFPLLLLAHGDSPLAAVAQPLAWALTIWGTVLYLLAGALYVGQAVGLLRADRVAGSAGTAS